MRKPVESEHSVPIRNVRILEEAEGPLMALLPRRWRTGGRHKQPLAFLQFADVRAAAKVRFRV